MAMAAWCCNNCNYSNKINQSHCNLCGCKINGEFVMKSMDDDVEETCYFYHDVDNWTTAKGPVTISELRMLYLTKEINNNTVIWNGTTLNKWTPLKKVDNVYSKIIKQQQFQAPTKHKRSFRVTLYSKLSFKSRRRGYVLVRN
eukprot:547272_1